MKKPEHYFFAPTAEQLMGASPPDPHRGSAPGPRIELRQVGLLDYVFMSTTGLQCSVLFSIMGRRLV